MDPVQIEYKNRNPSGHWFDADSMRFFQTRLGAQYWRQADDVWVFVSSECPPSGERAYSVRLLTVDGNIRTVGPFCELSQAQANRMAKQLATTGWTKLRVYADGYSWDNVYVIKDGVLESHENGRIENIRVA